MQDVTFDKSFFYNPNKPEPAHYLRDLMKQPLYTIAVPNHLSIQQNLNIEEGELTCLREFKDSPQSDETGRDIKDIVEQVQQYLTLAETPELT